MIELLVVAAGVFVVVIGFFAVAIRNHNKDKYHKWIDPK